MGEHPGEEPDITDEETPYPGDLGTTSSIVSAEDAAPYMSPSDAPVLPRGRGGIHATRGFGILPQDATAGEVVPRVQELAAKEV
jgi:hypothetical protein